MPKVSVVFEDRAVAVDGAGLILASLPQHDQTWRALQWDGKSGHIEKRGAAYQEFFNDASLVQPFIDAHAAAAQKYHAAALPVGHALPPDPPHAEPPPAPQLPPMPELPVAPPAAAPTAGATVPITGTKQL